MINSFELLLDENKFIDREFLQRRESQCCEVYPTLTCIGWYTTGDTLNEDDINFNEQVVVSTKFFISLYSNAVHLDVRADGFTSYTETEYCEETS